MKPVDKFGHDIYPHVFRKLVAIGVKLNLLGYVEAHTAPNLFYRSTKIVGFFADFRGTKEVPIWSEPVPLFYWKWNVDDLSLETKQNALYIEGFRLMGERIEFRFSYELHSSERYEDAFRLFEESPKSL